jgi:hypothetical protein
MKKTLLIVFGSVFVLLLVLVATGVISFNSIPEKNTESQKNIPDVFNTSYVIDGESFALVNGKVEKEYTPGSATKNILSIFGEPVYGDFDDDGDVDAGVMLQHNPGGSGLFYYAVFVMNDNGASWSTNAILLGDRIAPQTIEAREGYVIYNYAERGVDEPMTTPPSIGKSLYVKYNSDTKTISEFTQ